MPLCLAVHGDLTCVCVDPHTLTAESGQGLAVHLLQGELKCVHISLPLLVVDGEVLGEGVLLVSLFQILVMGKLMIRLTSYGD